MIALVFFFLPKWRQLFVKNGYKKPVFLVSKSSKFCVVWTIWFCSNFTSIWYKHFFLRNVWRDFRLPMSALATVGIVLMENLLQKWIFRAGIWCYHCWCWHWKFKVSPYIIWQVFGPHAGVIWKKIVWSETHKICAFWQKMVNNFWQTVDAILKDVSVTETIVW